MIADSSRPIVDYARGVLAQTEDLTRWISRSTEGSVGSIRVGMIDAAAIGHYSAVLQAFRGEHADIDFTLTVAPSSELLHLLAANRLDMAVVVRPAERPPGIGWDRLLTEPLAVYAPPGVDPGPPSSWGPWVAFNSKSHTRRLVAAAVAEAGAPFDVVAESNQPDVLRGNGPTGHGVDGSAGDSGRERTSPSEASST